MMLHKWLSVRRFGTSGVLNASKVCIVGSGPAAFYTAQQLLKGNKSVHIDMYEKLPVPFGLVRYGVAPDHPEVKNVINTFTQVAKNERFSYFGNVTVGKDVYLSELQNAYNATILAYGAAVEKKLEIPGSKLLGVYSAREFVGWYNGSPDNKDLNPSLDCETVAIVGNGNVALDVARILLSPISILKKTDIPEPVMDILASSRVRHVYLVGRRGPLQVAFTIKELREMIKLPQTVSHIPGDMFEGITKDFIESLPRPRRRLTDLMKSQISDPSSQTRSHTPDHRHWHLHFLRSPVAITGSQRVEGLDLVVNKLEGPLSESQSCVSTGLHELLSCGAVIPSIGYRSLKLEPDMPYDEVKGIVPNQLGRVTVSASDTSLVSGLYCVGWIKRGPVGVILTTMSDAVETSKAILEDLGAPGNTRPGAEHIAGLLKSRGVQSVSFSDWEAIDTAEVSQGSQLGKPREKLRTVSDMLRVVFSEIRNLKK